MAKDTLSLENAMELLKDAGYRVEEESSERMTINLLNDKIEENNFIINKLTLENKEMIKQIQTSLCKHSFDKPTYSDDWDGWSRIDYTQTTREKCLFCGYEKITKKECRAY